MLLLWCAAVFVTSGESARILGVGTVPSLSHQIVYLPIWKELSLRGHEVVIATPFPLKDPTLTNLTEIDLHYMKAFFDKTVNLQESTIVGQALSRTELIKWVLHFDNRLAQMVFNDSNFRKIYENPDEHFDLIITECLTAEVHVLGAHFNAPVIGVASIDAFLHVHTYVGNAIHPIFFPDIIMPYYSNPTLWEKFWGFYYFAWYRLYYEYVHLPYADKTVRQYFGNDVPYLGDLFKNVSMLFLNTPLMVHEGRPTVANVKYIEQMHIQPVKPLPSDLQKIMDDAKEGVIYLSLGTNVRCAELDKRILRNIRGALSELPYTFLWKWEAENFPGKPKNVVTRKWFPQQDVLAHNNVKAFITQGGLQSTEEAVARGVPIVGMPVLMDQPVNVDKMVRLGCGLGVDLNTVTKDELKRVITEVVTNPKYRTKIQEIGRIVRDKPMTGVESAVWWAEYVLRHKGAKHLRSPLADVTFFQYYLLDVVSVVLVIFVAAAFISFKLVKFGLLHLRISRKIKSQ